MLNVITMVGRLTRDPELRKTNSGNQVGGFTIACDDGRKGPNGEKQTLFMDCNIFGAQSDTLAKFFRKGKPIGVEGQIQTREYTDRDDHKRTAFEVVADRVFFVGGKDDAQPSGENPDPTPAPDVTVPASSGSASIGDDDDDLPF